MDAPERGGWRYWPIISSRKVSGCWAATAGPTTSVTAASITCSRATATSTCSSSTPKSIPTPAASNPRRPRAVAKFASGKEHGKERFGTAGKQLRSCVRRPRGHGGKNAANGAGISRGRSLSRAFAHHRLQPLHRPWLRYGSRHVTAEAGGGFRRMAAMPFRSAPPGQGRAAAPSRLWSTSASRRLHAQRVALPRGRAHDPARFKHFLKEAHEAAQKRYALYEQLAGITVPQVEARDEDTDVSKPAK